MSGHGMTLVAGMLALGVADAWSQNAGGEDAGETVFADLCSDCHQLHPHGIAPGQLDLSHFPTDSFDRFETVVRQGQGTMPPAGEDLDADEMDALWAYVVDVLEQTAN